MKKNPLDTKDLAAEKAQEESSMLRIETKTCEEMMEIQKMLTLFGAIKCLDIKERYGSVNIIDV